jgi:hypothetical protein
MLFFNCTFFFCRSSESRLQAFQFNSSNVVTKYQMDIDEEVYCGFRSVNWGEDTNSGE